MTVTVIIRRHASAIVGLVALVMLVALPGAARAQDNRLTITDVDSSEYPIVELEVLVPRALEDRSLSREPFTVVENGRTVQPYLGVTEDAEQTLAPRVVLALDVSQSMRRSLPQAKAAADEFVASLPEGSQVAVIAFGATVDVLVDATADLEAVRAKIAAARIDDQVGTALHEAVQQAAELAAGGGSTASASVVLLSDGADDQRQRTDAPPVTQDAAITALRDADARLWAVQLFSPSGEPAALGAIAGEDGRVLEAADAGELERIYEDLASDLSREYVLRYDSEASGRTDIAVTLTYGSFFQEDRIEAVIDTEPAAPASLGTSDATDPVGSAVSFPILSSFGALLVGVTTLVAASLVFWLAVLLPRIRRPGDRLVEYTESTGDRLTALARWTTEAADRRLRSGSAGERLDAQLESAGLNIRPGEFVVTVASAMVVAGAIGFMFGNLLIGLVLTLLTPLAVRVWLGTRRDRRQAAFADQLTEVLQLTAGSLRAGYSLTQAIDAVARDADEPAATEFRRIIIEHRLGRDLNEAMQNCADRMDNEDFLWVVQAIGIHRDVGGDLAKVLDNIVATIRDRAAVQRQVRTLSAEGRMSARVLTALPIVVLVGLQFTSPGYLAPMFGNPIGLLLLGLAATLLLVGMIVVQRMSKIRY